MKAVGSWLRRLGAEVYGAAVPMPDGRPTAACADLLEELWASAPRWLAIAHTLIAVAAYYCLPLAALGRLRTLEGLEPHERDEALARLLRARWYPLRLAAYALKGHALLAALRQPRERALLLPPEPEAAPRTPPPSPPGAPSRPSGAGEDAEVDFIVVGSGAGGASAAVTLAEAGASVLIVEEGPWRRAPDFTLDLFGAVSSLFRDWGAQAARGPAAIPILQGRCVGGSTVLSGAISHRLPREAHESWEEGLRRALPFELLEERAAALEAELGLRENIASELQALPAAQALRRLGWSFRAMPRIAPGCQATGRCLQGCPSGGKHSMENSMIPRALHAGAALRPELRVERILTEGRRAVGIEARSERGSLRLKARRAVVLAAGVVHSPALLQRSGLGGPHAGRHFQCHLSLGVSALMPRPVRELEGPPQGIEITEFERSGFKLATQLVPAELRLARAPLIGAPLTRALASVDRVACWTASVRSAAEGSVRARGRGVAIRFAPAQEDLERLREAVARLCELLFALGAREVYPSLYGAPERLLRPSDTEQVRLTPPLPSSFWLGAGHLFGTCRIGTDPRSSVVDPDFRVHGMEGLAVTDASVFPAAIGVNPLLAIMTLARVGAERQLR